MMTRAAALLGLLLLAVSAPGAGQAQQVPNPMSRDGSNAKLPDAVVNLTQVPGAVGDGTTDDTTARQMPGALPSRVAAAIVLSAIATARLGP
jgi:hypothetical protein